MEKYFGWGPASLLLIIVIIIEKYIPTVPIISRLIGPELPLLALIFAIISLFKEKGVKRYVAIIPLLLFVLTIFAIRAFFSKPF